MLGAQPDKDDASLLDPLLEVISALLVNPPGVARRQRSEKMGSVTGRLAFLVASQVGRKVASPGPAHRPQPKDQFELGSIGSERTVIVPG